MEEKHRTTPIEVYNNAIEQYRVCKRELNECEIDIDIARMRKDTEALRKALSNKNRLLDCVIEAKENVQRATVDVVRERGMQVERVKQEPGLLQKVLDKIMKI